MQGHDWHSSRQRAFVALLQGGGGRLALLFNPEPEDLPFTVLHGPWQVLIDSSATLAEGPLTLGQPLIVCAHSLVLLGPVE